jgi:hypothetical protein
LIFFGPAALPHTTSYQNGSPEYLILNHLPAPIKSLLVLYMVKYLLLPGNAESVIGLEVIE